MTESPLGTSISKDAKSFGHFLCGRQAAAHGVHSTTQPVYQLRWSQFFTLVGQITGSHASEFGEEI